MADLLEIRQQFVKLSGRYDLASESTATVVLTPATFALDPDGYSGEDPIDLVEFFANYDKIMENFFGLIGRHPTADELESLLAGSTITVVAVAPAFVDSGANWFINAGIRWLDTHQEHALSLVEHITTLSAGDWYVDVEHLRTPKSVWFVNSEGSRRELTPCHYDWFVKRYPNSTTIGNGTPLFWASYIAHRAPGQVVYSDDDPPVESPAGISYSRHRIAFMPPVDGAYDLSVFGKFHQRPLVLNGDENFWSLSYPDILVMAALMSLEGFYRNSQGVADYRTIIEDALTGLDKDFADTADSVSPQRMEG